MTPRTAMILAAGRGARMRPLTNDRPKALVCLAGKTLIDRVLDLLKPAGIERVIVNVHYLADQIETHLKQRTDFEIIISDERSGLLDSGGGVVKAKPLFGNQPVFILNADTCWEDDGGDTFLKLAADFDPDHMDMRILVADRRRTLGYAGQGDFLLDAQGRISRGKTGQKRPYVMAGCYILSPLALDAGLRPPFPAMKYWQTSIERKRLFGAILAPFWMHIGDTSALAEAERHLAGYPQPVIGKTTHAG